MSDLVSVIIAVYNVEKYLKRCLKSVINQTYKNIEIVLVDDGSKDSSGKICDEYKEKYENVVVTHKKNGGLASARNAGLELAKGEYVCFIDSDDWLEENYVEVLYNKIKENKSQVVRCEFYKNNKKEQKIETEGTDKETKYNKEQIRENLIPEILLGKRMCYTWALMIKKDVAKKIKFDESKLLLEDTCFFLNLLLHIENIILIPNPLYHYYENTNSLTRSAKKIEKNMYHLLEINEYIQKELKKVNLDEYCKITDKTYFVIIINHILKFYRANYSNKDIEKCIKKINKNEQFRKMCNRIDKSEVKAQYKIALKLLEKGNYKLLLLVWKVIYILKG